VALREFFPTLITITIITIKNLYSACSQKVSRALRRRLYINIEQKSMF